MAALQALEKLLLLLFSADELRRWLRYLPGGEAIYPELPGANASPAALVSEAVGVLARDGWIGEDFWARLVAERPRRKGEIDSVRVLFASEATTVRIGGGKGTEGAVKTVLLVSASPETEVRLRVDREFRDIIDGVRRSRYRDRLHFVQVHAARFEDLSDALQEHEPHILHISSHGNEDGSLIFEGRADEPRVIAKHQLKRLLSATRVNLELVVCNACHSYAVVSDLTDIVEHAIGMSDAIPDDVAIRFSVAFYKAIGNGLSVKKAFDVAIAGLDPDDDDNPRLFPPG